MAPSDKLEQVVHGALTARGMTAGEADGYISRLKKMGKHGNGNEVAQTPIESALEAIPQLSEEQLLDLNHIVISQINYLEDRRNLQEAIRYPRGQTIEWRSRGGSWRDGRILRTNRKTVTLRDTDTGTEWRVAYCHLRPQQQWTA